MSHKIRVWDLPTRLFHWSLASCVIGLVITGQIGGAAMDWHFRLGYAALTLLLFRLAWGLVGGHWSRFSAFLYSPSSFLRYLRGERSVEQTTGHTPLGAGSVFAMLLFLLVQVGTGLISDDEIASSGPLTRFVASSWVSQATAYHAEVGKLILIVLVALHVGAILFYYFRKHENLVRPMLLGDKVIAEPAPSSRDDLRSRLVALVLISLCAGMVGWMLKLAA